MTKPLNIAETDERKFFVSSDWHLGHRRPWIVESRGFQTVEEHDSAVIKSINDTVRPTDVLLFLGDFCLNSTAEQFEGYLSRINCQEIMTLWGNHNSRIGAAYDGIVASLGLPADIKEVYPVRYRNLVFYGYYLELTVNHRFFVACHYPIYSFNHMKDHSGMLCGHSHNNCELSHVENAKGKYLDVGWDGHRKPLSFREIADIFDSKTLEVVDHHQK